MDSVSDFEVVKSLGRQGVRKFNDVTLVKNRITSVLGVKKQITIHDKNEHLIHLLRQESELNFQISGLPKTLAFEENDSTLTLIRSYLPGIPLDEFWKKLPKIKRLDFLKTLIKNLTPIFNELNRLSIVHCDIKPTNILITPEWECSLIDFGMAIKTDTIEPRKTLFALGYSAPELILNELKLVNQTTDIFALGITLWQLFTGKLPLTHPNPGIMTNLQITHPLPTDKRIPKEWMTVIQKMCWKHQFNLPPSHLKKEEVQVTLKNSMQLRFQNLQEISKVLENSQVTQKWFEFWKKN